ncbi:CLUMA_CG013632, isoform A [Clunio marinus]|uniref:CLUMA_CG013632, isoform A n=1 Tax=Clunio marinus TaxID=568069 RepID=A0A1J1IPE2_9DIPT|nr:CLUMA_CG013632, isoform A [Clunio marinus]
MSAPMWFAHRLNDWSKLAKERVKRATGDSMEQDSTPNLSDSKTSTSSDDGSMQRESQKSANSSFEECNVKTNSPQSSAVLQHQSKSFPPRHLQRTSSISSESSLENLHQQRGSSPQIRFSGLSTGDGHDSRFLHSRSPSPMRDLRAISLDARSMSPSDYANLKSSSPSQANLFFGATSNLLQSSSSSKINRPPLLLPPRSDACTSNPAPPSPLGALQLDLYTRQAGPIVINAPENSTCIGKLHLRVNYDSKCSDLQIHLIEAHNLSPFEEGGFREVYVRLELKPEIDQRKRETNIFRFDTNPYFNQHFKFPVSRDQLSEKELILHVLDADKCSSDISGELKVSIVDIDLTKSNEIWGDIIRVKRHHLDRPELLISLNFLPGAERLTVVIMKAKNLEFDEIYVKFYLIQNGKRIKKKKTNFSKKSFTDHTWNEAFTFNLPSSSFNNSGLELYVLENGSDESNAIGSCGIGLDESIGKDDTIGRDHWLDMIHNPRKPMFCWHPIVQS